MEKSEVTVGLAELKVVGKSEILVAYAIGSCVAVILYDSRSKIAGLAHVMLPSKNGFSEDSKEGKFADTAIEALVKEMKALGADEKRLIAKIAGGACMFGKETDTDINVGQRNVDKVREILKNKKIYLKADDTGGRYARTVRFFSQNGKGIISSAKLGITKEF